MSRRHPGIYGPKVTVHLDDAMRSALDQWQHNFGIDSRSDAALAMMRAGCSAVPLDTAVFEISQASVRERQEAEIAALVAYYESRLALYRGNR